ncbi:uncharacterized protein LOC143620493 [Bidens hawaiensis]|uniref:uncharacterized protein LOC143620493 n=1 Tax=Bidens hawaiensis TaxID=980011 RepID=UPI004049DC49
MPFPDEESLYVINNRLILDEQSYDQEFERKEFQKLFSRITSEQKAIFDTITKAIHKSKKRALLAPTNEVVHEINDRLIESFPGEPVEYLSSDSVSKSEYIDGNVDPTLYSTELLDGLKIAGPLNHSLILKVGVPVMLLRNIDQKKGLCNGTRLQVISLGTHVIEVKILSGTNTGEKISIPRIALTPSDKNIAFKFTR